MLKKIEKDKLNKILSWTNKWILENFLCKLSKTYIL